MKMFISQRGRGYCIFVTLPPHARCWGVCISRGEEEKLIRKWCFFFLSFLLNPGSAEAPFLLDKKTTVSFTLLLQSHETPLQTMWRHQLNSQLSWGRNSSVWENIETWHRLSMWACVNVWREANGELYILTLFCWQLLRTWKRTKKEDTSVNQNHPWWY